MKPCAPEPLWTPRGGVLGSARSLRLRPLHCVLASHRPAHLGGEASFRNGFHVLVAPKEHRERVVEDFSADEYLALQAVVHGVGQAICRAVPTERLYVLSLGSRHGNAHVHWHLAPLPPGVPFEEQQLAALDTDLGLELGDDQLCELAGRIRAALDETGKEPPGA